MDRSGELAFPVGLGSRAAKWSEDGRYWSQVKHHFQTSLIKHYPFKDLKQI